MSDLWSYLAIGLFVLVFVVIIVLFIQNWSLRKAISNHPQQIDQKAREQYQAWCDNEIASIRTQQYDLAHQEISIKAEEWKSNYTGIIRRDAIQSSKSVLYGNATQHSVPFMPDFPYNPSDVRFIGSPIDLIIFDGLQEGDLRSIVFAEVKTGKRVRLNEHQEVVRDAVLARDIEWKVIWVKRDAGEVSEEAQVEKMET